MDPKRPSWHAPEIGGDVFGLLWERKTQHVILDINDARVAVLDGHIDMGESHTGGKVIQQIHRS